MRLFTAVLAGLGVVSAQTNTAQNSIVGFTAESAKKELTQEAAFDSLLDRSNLSKWLKRLSSRPHHLGSPAGKENAEFIAAQFRSWGFDTHIETFYPLFPTPKTRLLEMTAPERFTAKLSEPPIPGDESSAKAADGLPVFNAYSIDGDVTGPLVYVNYGLPADYEILAENGIDVRGKIVIARYGASWRGIKPKVAAEHGALGCIIYSDPRDDGYFQGDEYPKGGWRAPYSAQRGSVMDMPTYPGDPLTPGRPATKDAQRGPYRSAETLTKIPVLPISWSDALPMLKHLSGPVAPEGWRGALPITYHMGGGPATVHMKVEFNWDLAPAYDVIARLEGQELPDEWILRGNHHDGWVFGASDPLSALVALMEEARTVGELAKSGWRPKRTMIYAAWDGEEPALLGSTEWVEAHAEELQKHAAVYVNSDVTGRGFLGISGSHTLERLMNQTARDLTDPETKVSSLERYQAWQMVQGSGLNKAYAKEKQDFALTAMGSGSDYTPFIQHLGIASLDLRFGGEGTAAGSYHSNYDTYDHLVKFEDPDFQYIFATAQLGGRTMLRLANADVLPLDFAGVTRAISSYVTDLQSLADGLRTSTLEENARIADRSYELAADPAKAHAARKPKAEVPFINFTPLQNAASVLAKSNDRFRKVHARFANASISTAEARELDEIFMRTERVLTSDKGLPRRPWYRHLIYAPGYYTGYGVKTIPGVREAIEERNWAEAEQQIPIAAHAIEALAGEIDRATEVLSKSLR